MSSKAAWTTWSSCQRSPKTPSWTTWRRDTWTTTSLYPTSCVWCCKLYLQSDGNWRPLFKLSPQSAPSSHWISLKNPNVKAWSEKSPWLKWPSSIFVYSLLIHPQMCWSKHKFTDNQTNIYGHKYKEFTLPLLSSPCDSTAHFRLLKAQLNVRAIFREKTHPC